jgi:hypothetical protein
MDDYACTCPQCYQKRRREAVKAVVFAHYGLQCACCGATDDLTIDHVNGGGEIHRQQLFGDTWDVSLQFYRWLITQGFPPEYQTLCVRCNASKGTGPACRIEHMADPDTKQCIICHAVKPLDDFHHNSREHDGHDTRCKGCKSEADRGRQRG